MRHSFGVLLCCSLVSLSAFGQNTAQLSPCGFDNLRQTFLNADPSYRQKEENVNRILYQQAINPSATSRNIQTVMYIPIVVHIVHLNGPENISDSTVIAAVNQLNLRFQNAAPFYDGSGTPVGIQFCLASVDPAGNPSTGITRNVSSNTDIIWTTGPTNDAALKNINRWDPHIYFNVWVIRHMTMYAGYSSFPISMGNGDDGVVIEYNYFNTSAMAHEAGHYLGLYHTFEGGCANENCLLNGDHICDTPPDGSQTSGCPQNSCSTDMNDTSGFNPFTSDMSDLPNYMDYTSCPLSFTQGQCNRMNASLTQIRSELLQSNGCGSNPGGAVPVASFTASAACGGTILTNTSLNSVGAQWDLNNDGLIDECGNVLNFNAPVTGSYTITMYATGYGGMDTITQTIFAQHYPYSNYPLVNGYMGVSLSASGHLVACQGATITFQGAPGMAHYHWSNGDTTQNTTFIQGTSPFTISLYTIDSAGLTWTTCYPISIGAAAATIPPVISIAPGDTVFCVGQPVHLLISYSPIWYSGHLSSYQGTIQGFHNSTYSPTLDNFNYYSIYQTDTNGCISTSNTININGTSPTYPSNIIQLGNNLLYYSTGLHNQWYFNGTPIPNSDTAIYQMTQIGCYKCFSWWFGSYDCGSFSTDSVCLTVLGVQENSGSINTVSISPNPFTSQTVFSFSGEQQHTTIKIMDAVGKIVRSEELVHGKELVLDMSGFAKGIYFARIEDENKNVVNKKIILQ